MNMLSKAEEQYEDLIKKKDIVEMDKAKIVDTDLICSNGVVHAIDTVI